jgi:hypothetical protein
VTGINTFLPQAEFDLWRYFQAHNGFMEGEAYRAMQALREGRAVEVWAGGGLNVVRSEEDLHELEGVFGRQDDAYELLRQLGDGFQSGGERRLNSYQALQALQDGQALSYGFVGGDYGERLELPVGSLESLVEVRERRDNQREYDRYRYSDEEFLEKLKHLKSELPELARADLAQSLVALRAAREGERQARQELGDAEQGVSQAETDLRDAESRSAAAFALPFVTPDGEHDWNREAASGGARSEQMQAESALRQARLDEASAGSEVSAALQEVRQAELAVAEAEEILERLAAGEAPVGVLQRLAHTAELRTNLEHQLKLQANQATRPERPAGWQVPTPLAQ